ncbi:hypothetical protein [Mitsuokella sp.]|uniref:hypothetical protein n=1 Tax=Mitsuokella sp. TaxID=2049034 RepID=UPI003D7DD01D
MSKDIIKGLTPIQCEVLQSLDSKRLTVPEYAHLTPVERMILQAYRGLNYDGREWIDASVKAALQVYGPMSRTYEKQGNTFFVHCPQWNHDGQKKRE